MRTFEVLYSCTRDYIHGQVLNHYFGQVYYYIKIKLSPNSGAATSGAVGRQLLKFGVRVRHRKGAR